LKFAAKVMISEKIRTFAADFENEFLFLL